MRVALILLVAVGAMPALAADGAGPAGSIGRFELAPADTGFTRLDTQTGAVSHCDEKAGAWVCTPLATDNSLTGKVDALSAEVARLAAALSALPDATAAAAVRVDALSARVEALAGDVAALADAAAKPVVIPPALAAAPTRPIVPEAAAVASHGESGAPIGFLAEAVERFLALVGALKHGNTPSA